MFDNLFMNICNLLLIGNYNSQDKWTVPDDAESTGAGTETETRTKNSRLGSKGTWYF